MKIKTLIIFSISILTLSFSLTACNQSSISLNSNPRFLSPNTLNIGYLDNFYDYNSYIFEKTDGANYGDFGCGFIPDQISFSNSKLKLKLEERNSYLMPYSSGEYKSVDYYLYGTFEVRTKPAKGIGTVSSFFTYTGPVDDCSHDEIDFEFIWYNTSDNSPDNIIQCNYFVNGTDAPYLYYPSWDPSLEFHNYKIEWTPTEIKWYIDDNIIHSATTNVNMMIHQQRIFMNLWNGVGTNAKAWLGEFDDSLLPITAEYDWVKYTPYN